MQLAHNSQFIDDRLITKLKLAYTYLDHSLRVQSISANFQSFGLPEIPMGSDVTDHLDFMVGIDAHTELEFTCVGTATNKPITVRLLPDQEGVLVVISDATQAFAQRQALQQQANENQLLLDQQKKLMQQLEEASRLQTVFLSGVSHEFRTPLSSIIGYSNLLNRQIDSINQQLPKAGDYLSAIRRSSSHLLSLVENLLDHGKLDSEELFLKPKPTDLAQVFDDVSILLTPLTTTKNIQFSVNYDFANDQLALLDDSRLRQCLINLIGNAIKFTDQGSVKVQAHWRDEQLKVTITDTGIGINQADIDNICLPFWQAPNTGKAGTGLGLTITQRIIELMGGELRVDSILALGTTVEFDFMVPALQSDRFNSDEPVAPVAQSLNILLAEDDSDIAELVVLLLTEKGMQVTRVENGALAVDLSSRNDFDVILMDIHMPIVDGIEAIRLIREQGNSTPIIVMSASPIETQSVNAEQLDCEGYLVKPVDIDDVLSLANQLRRQRD